MQLFAHPPPQSLVDAREAWPLGYLGKPLNFFVPQDQFQVDPAPRI